jgi:hypothetical protein
MARLDLVDWPADRTLTLSGLAGALRIPLTLRNSSAETVEFTEASLAEVRLGGGGASLRADPVLTRLSVAGNGVTRTALRLRLDPATPPGRYEGKVNLAGQGRTVAIDVLPETKLSIRPAPVVVDAAAGRDQTFTVALENSGNVPLAIDLTGHYPLGEEVPIPPDRIAETTAGDNPLAAIFDRVLGRAPAPTLVPFGVVKLAMPGGPELLPPGGASAVQVSMSLPEGLSPTARYHLFAPLYAADLHIVVVTGAKSSIPAKPARRPRGTPG